MHTQPSIFDPDGLKEAEEAYRFELRREPNNMDTRVNLAWCLLLQAVYQSGQETMIAEQSGWSDKPEYGDPGPTLSPGPDARHLLQECLHQSLMVRHLSAHPANQLDVEKLEALVLLAGGKEIMLASDEGGKRIRDRISRALWRASDQPNTEIG